MTIAFFAILGLLASALPLWSRAGESFSPIFSGNAPYQNALYGLDPRKTLEQYAIDIWTTEQGLPSNIITSIIQTRDGYLWITTLNGLVRFDGVRVRVFSRANTPILTSNGFWNLREDESGVLWMGSTDGGLIRYEKGLFRAYTTQDGLKSNYVRALCLGGDGVLWLGTPAGLHKFAPNGAITPYTSDSTLGSASVLSLYKDARGALWVGTVNDGVFVIINGKIVRRYARKEGLPNGSVEAVAEDRSGAIWIALNGGLCRITNGALSVFSMKDGLPSNYVEAVYTDRAGTLWVGTQGGLCRFNGTDFTVLGVRGGLSGSECSCIYEDREGSLWLGIWGSGLNKLSDTKFTFFALPEGDVDNNSVNAIIEDPRLSGIWALTNKGAWGVRNGRIIGSFRHPALKGSFYEAFLTGRLRDGLRDRRGDFWICSQAHGVFRFGETAAQLYTTKDGLSRNQARLVYQDGQGNIWIGTNSGLNTRRGNGFVSYTHKDGLSGDFILSIQEDSKGNLLIGTDGTGLNVLDSTGHCRIYTTQNGLSNNVVFRIYEDKDGVLWIGTHNGLCRFKNGVFTAFQGAGGLSSAATFQVLEDDVGYLWMTTPNGIVRVRKNDLNEFAEGKRSTLSPTLYGKADGLKSNECTSVGKSLKTSDGKLWFATTRGAAMIDPRFLRTNTLVPPVFIESLLADMREIFDSKAAAGGEVIVAAGTKSFALSYTALSFVAPHKVRFRIKLEGFDEEWRETTAREVFYTNLAPREYTFRVLACNNDGIWNEAGASVRFTVRPYFYQTFWFYVLCFAFATVGAYGAYRRRVALIRARAEALERVVAERTSQLQRQSIEIEAANAELQNTNRYLDEANRFKTQMLSIVAHDLKNPLNNILGFASLGLYEAQPESQAAQMLGKVEHSAEQMMALIKDLLDTAAIELGSVRVERKRFSLSFLLVSVCEVFRRTAALKEQEIIMEIQHEVDIEGDEERLRQVFDNLLSNAIKYSPRGKRIWVTLRREGGQKAYVEISDEGPGFTEEDETKLFSFFQRLSAQPTGGEHSTGVGLAIVKKIIEMHDGTISLIRKEGRGATFVVELRIGLSRL